MTEVHLARTAEADGGRVPGRRGPRAGGFTLIELLVVVAIVGILAGAAIGSFAHAQKKAREAVLKHDLHVFRELLDQHYADKGKYPVSLEDLVSAGYLRAIPVDPMTDSAETWVTVMEEPSELDEASEVEPGVYDVHSGSEETGTDGRPYSEW